jgi:hypothetical protein
MHRYANTDRMTGWDQVRPLPHRNTDGRSTSIAGCCERKDSTCWPSVAVPLIVEVALHLVRWSKGRHAAHPRYESSSWQLVTRR